jgi:hypothetical protein
MRNGCEKYAIDYIVGIAKNSRLLKQAQPLIHEAQRLFDLTGHKQRLFGDLVCAAGSWRYARRIIAKAEHSRKGANPRFVVTNMAGNATELCDQLCCARGEAENRSKEQQLDLSADRTSCMNWRPTSCGTIRLKLLKIGAVIVRNIRRVHLMLSSACPYQDLFIMAANCQRST